MLIVGVYYMTSFISAEYVIAKLLIEKANANKYEITIGDICSYAVRLQKECNEQNFDVVFLTSAVQIRNTLRNYKDYFEFDEQTDRVKIEHTKTVEDLQWHFMCYLPEKVAHLGGNYECMD